MTVLELAVQLAKLVKAGKGGMKVIVSDDEEGNGFHEIFYGVTMADEFIAECEDQTGCEPLGLEPHTVMIG